MILIANKKNPIMVIQKTTTAIKKIILKKISSYIYYCLN